MKGTTAYRLLCPLLIAAAAACSQPDDGTQMAQSTGESMPATDDTTMSGPTATGGPEALNMRLVAHHPLQGRSAYHPIPHRYGDRYILFVGHHDGETMNPLTGQMEVNGMSVLDITDPASPQLLTHLPPSGEALESQHVQVCDGSTLPDADDETTYLIRTNGQLGVELLDVTDPGQPTVLSTVYTTGETENGRRQTHKIQWVCETGIAYLNGTPEGWRAPRILQIYDLSNPETPRHVRDFGLDGAQPGASGPPSTPLHQPFAYGNRVYLGYGASNDGVMQIVDRERLLNGDPNAEDPMAPTPQNLAYPEISRLDMPSVYGAHTVKPIYEMPVADHADNAQHSVIDIALLVSEETTAECEANRDAMFIVDITEEDKPFPISSFQVPESSGNFCERGGRFGPHSPQDAYHPGFDRTLVILAYFNAGIRAVDIRDPYRPQEVGYLIPEMTEQTIEMCDVDRNNQEVCSRAIQTNNVNIDDRGYIYALDRANTGLHIIELTGEARQIAGL